MQREARGRLRDPRKVLFSFGQWGWCRIDIHAEQEGIGQEGP